MHFSDTVTMSPEEVLRKLHTSPSGLAIQEANERRKVYGDNALKGQETHWHQILIRQLASPFLYLLVVAAVVSYFLHETVDALMILLFVGINTGLGFYQEYRSEKTLQLLKQFIITKTKILRVGKEELEEGAALVPGDIVLLGPGDIIPADIRLIQAENLRVDESVLTGESVAVTKQTAALKQKTTAIYEATNIGFSGTSVISGKGQGVVIATGGESALGEIAQLTTATAHKSNFEKEISSLSIFILKLIVATLIIIVAANLLLKGGTTNIFTLLVFAIALAISAIPEALPVVTTFCLSRGALHLARHKVVVKRLSAIEDLGSIEMLCTDKTGTLTENKLTVVDVFPKKNEESLRFMELSTPLGEHQVLTADPFDSAIHAYLSKSIGNKLAGYEKLQEVLFTPARRRNTILAKKGSSFVLLLRGAPETLLALCRDIPKTQHAKILEQIAEEGKKGHRVLAIAKKDLKTHPANIEKEENNLTFVCLISFVDPLKKSANEAILKAEKLGVKIKILTGDSSDVAGSVALQAGLIKDASDVMTGDTFDALSLEGKRKALQTIAVFARTSPLQKHMIVLMLQETYEVGFLGEGINDAPALKTANVAIVVQGASGIAREASDIVLLHKSLDVVVDGIREGREIFGNTAKYIKATLASNFGNFYTIAIVSLFIPFLPLLPLQILLINLLTDFPMIAVATDTNDEGSLRRPKSYDIKEIALFATIMGIVSTLFDFLFFAVFVRISPEVLQTNWFIGSVLTELLFLFAIRTKLPVWRAKRASFPLIALSGVAFFTAIILPFTDIGARVFSFITPQPIFLLLTFCITIAYFVATEITKLLYYKFVDTSTKQEKP